jgi:hypothetical protein
MSTLHMRPNGSPENRVHGAFVKARFKGQFARRRHPLAVSPPHISHDLGGDLGSPVMLAPRHSFWMHHGWVRPPQQPRATPLLVHISHVVALCADKQVSRVAAGRVVAPVEYAQAIWDGAVAQAPRQAMCSDPLPLKPGGAVATRVRRAGPYPAQVEARVEILVGTRAVPIDALPESFGVGLHCTCPPAGSCAEHALPDPGRPFEERCSARLAHKGACGRMTWHRLTPISRCHAPGCFSIAGVLSVAILPQPIPVGRSIHARR